MDAFTVKKKKAARKPRRKARRNKVQSRVEPQATDAQVRQHFTPPSISICSRCGEPHVGDSEESFISLTTLDPEAAVYYDRDVADAVNVRGRCGPRFRYNSAGLYAHYGSPSGRYYVVYQWLLADKCWVLVIGPKLHDLTASSFWRALISYLIVEGEHGIQPRSPADRRGFTQLVTTIDDFACEHKDDDGLYRTLVRLRNYLQAGNNGAFENIETELRELQTSALVLPNSDYDDMRFTLSKSYARSILDNLGPKQLQLVERVGSAFCTAKHKAQERP